MSRSGSKIWLAAAVGLAAGIGVGMLIAPAKGSKTRKRLKKRIMGIADMVEDGLSEKLNAIKSALSNEDMEDLDEEDEMIQNQEVK